LSGPSQSVTLPSVSPEPRTVGSGWRNPAALPSGTQYVDAICESFAQQDRLAKIEALSKTVANLQADEIARLKAEIERLEAELKKAGK
jgi:uncharacterized small protein (DUF1192 family)